MRFTLLPFFAALGIFLLSSACDMQAQPHAPSAVAGASYQNIDVPLFKKYMSDPNAVVLDVRTPAEIAQGKIQGAMELDFTSPDFAQKVSQLDKSKTYLVYCRSGNRSGQACSMMQQQGFSKLYNLRGGMIAWGRQ